MESWLVGVGLFLFIELTTKRSDSEHPWRAEKWWQRENWLGAVACLVVFLAGIHQHFYDTYSVFVICVGLATTEALTTGLAIFWQRS